MRSSNPNFVSNAGLALRSGYLGKHIESRFIEQHQPNQNQILRCAQTLNQSRNRNPGGVFDGVSKNSCRNCGEGYAVEAQVVGDAHGLSMATLEHRRLAVPSSMPDGANRMD